MNQEKPQKVIIPKGTINSNETSVIEIPNYLYDSSIIVARPKLQGSFHESPYEETYYAGPQENVNSRTSYERIWVQDDGNIAETSDNPERFHSMRPPLSNSQRRSYYGTKQDVSSSKGDSITPQDMEPDDEFFEDESNRQNTHDFMNNPKRSEEEIKESDIFADNDLAYETEFQRYSERREFENALAYDEFESDQISATSYEPPEEDTLHYESNEY